MRKIRGAVEGGGTKFNLLLGTGPDDIVEEVRIPTTTPEETLGRAVEFFSRPRSDIEISAIGVASFGPIDLDPSSPTYGHITTTPKPGWSYADVVGTLQSALHLPIGWDTDVNGAALGEYRWGAGQDIRNLVYLTVGTGIGGGAIVDGRPVHGLLHPEMGHLLLPAVDGDLFPGNCPFHGRCLEGLASGPALQKRLGKPAQEVGPDDPVWALEAQYLAAGLYNIALALSPQRIVVGGGVVEAPNLLERVRQHFVRMNRGYLAHPEFGDAIDSFIVPPNLGARSGTLGALELARLADEGVVA